MLRNILIFIPMLFCLIMGSLAFLSPDIIGGILGVSADNAAGRGTISGDFGGKIEPALGVYLTAGINAHWSSVRSHFNRRWGNHNAANHHRSYSCGHAIRRAQTIE